MAARLKQVQVETQGEETQGARRYRPDSEKVGKMERGHCLQDGLKVPGRMRAFPLRCGGR